MERVEIDFTRFFSSLTTYPKVLEVYAVWELSDPLKNAM
jgi:hypothetical protein